MGQVVTTSVKFGSHTDLTKNFVQFVPAPQDGTLTIKRESGVEVFKILADDSVQYYALATATNLTFTGASARIRGDFSNADQSKRVLFQSSTADIHTSVGAIANGTSKIANFVAYGGSDALNCSRIIISVDGGAGTASLTTDRLGTGAYVPLLFFTGGKERFRLDAVNNRFMADFSVAGVEKFAFQSSVVNGYTGLVALPNGTAKVSAWTLWGGSDQANAPYLNVVMDSATGYSYLHSGQVGSAAALPMVFQVNNIEMFRLTTNQKFQANFDALWFQHSTVNAGTTISVVPNGTGNFGAVVAWGGSDTSNAQNIHIACNSAASNAYLAAHKGGSVAYPSFSIIVGGGECIRLTTAGRFQANFDALWFQPLVANGNTNLNLVPSGTANFSSISMWGGSDPNNASVAQLTCSPGWVSLVGSRNGTGPVPNMQFSVGGTERFRLPAGVNRFHAEFNNANSNNNLMFQNINGGSTQLGVMTNTSGSGAAAIACYSTWDANNAARIRIGVDGDVQQIFIASEAAGGYSQWPIRFWCGGERMRIAPDGTTNIYGGLAYYGGSFICSNTIELGAGTEGQGNRNTFIDMHSHDGVDFSARIIREPGPNGNFQLSNTGGGQFIIVNNSTFAVVRAFPAGQINLGCDAPDLGQAGTIAFNALRCKQGLYGAWGGNYYNIHWNASAAQLWVDGTNVGNISLASDPRLKKNIRAFRTVRDDALEQVMQWDVIYFNWRDLGIWQDDGKAKVGFNARSMHAVSPEVIYGEPGDLTIDGKIQPLLINTLSAMSVLTAALQELTRKFEAAEARIAALEAA